MRVTPIKVEKKGSVTRYSADFIFSSLHGGKKKKLLFLCKWMLTLFTDPRYALHHGWKIHKTIWYTIPSSRSKFVNYQDAFFTIALPLAIAMNEDLHFENAVSKKILAKSSAIHTYYREIFQREIAIFVQTSETKIRSTKKSGQFFTLGVDSFYSLYRNLHTKQFVPDFLLYVEGYDVPFYERSFLNTIQKHIKKVTRSSGIKSLTLQTNLREVSDPVIGWGRYHVSALVAVATLLGLEKIGISGESFDSADWGLRSGVDRLYSTRSLKVQLIGHNMPRDKKIRWLVKSRYNKSFLKSVRVCWENVRLSEIPYNCSVCQKCSKTQLSLLALGIKKAPTFAGIDIAAVEKIQLVEHVYKEWKEMFAVLKHLPTTDPELLGAIEKVLKKPLRT
jgi:hypothetical protein